MITFNHCSKVLLMVLLILVCGCKQVAKKAVEDTVETTAKQEVKSAITETVIRKNITEVGEIVISKETKEANSKAARQFIYDSGRKISIWDRIFTTINKRFLKMSEKMTPELLHEMKRFVSDKKLLEKIISDLEKNPELLSSMNRNPNLLKIWELLINISYRTDAKILNLLESFRIRYVIDGKGDKALWETMIFAEKDGSLICKSKLYPNTQMMYKDGVVKCSAGSAGKGGGPLNEFLMAPRMPNTKYIIDEVFVFTTDAFGRTSSIRGRINKSIIERIDRYRNPTAQSLAIESAGDAGGHGIAYALGGPSELINLTSMKASLNNGEYKAIENAILKAIEDGETVTIVITNIYKEGASRPSKYIYEYTINGKKFTKVLTND